MSTIFKATALAFATSSLLLAGCGGSSNDDSVSATQNSGKVVDFYLVGANVLFKDCAGTSTTRTDAQGGFNFPNGCHSSGITVLGGVDIGTGLPFNGELKAPASNSSFIVVSPLTTIISNLSNNHAAAEASIALQLGMAGKKLLTVDPMTDKKVLVATVVSQQLMNQMLTGLLKLSAAEGGQLTAQQAAQAAAMGVANQFNQRNSSNVDFTKLTTISHIVEAAVNDLATNRTINAFGPEALNHATALAQNTAAISAAVIKVEVDKVNDAIKDVDIKGNPTATLQALGNKLNAIREANNSQVAANLVALLAPVLTNEGIQDELEKLAQEVANGSSDSIKAAFDNLNSQLPTDQKLSQDVLNDLVELNTYENYLKLTNVGFNNGKTFTIEELMNAYKSGNDLTVNGGFKNVQLNVSKVGNPFKGNASEAKVGLSYTINNANTLNLIVDKVNLSFDSTGKLTAANIPANAAIAFNTTGAITASNPNMTNLSMDNLSVDNNGILSLPVDVFLNKVAAKDSSLKPVINSYTPKAGDKVTIHVALAATANTGLEVGVVTNGKAQPADLVSINTDKTSIMGQGVNTKLMINQ